MSVRLVVHHGARELRGVVHAGESLFAAARRIAATVPGEPVARDLSGDPARFEVDPDLTVVLRAMTHGDLPLVTAWRRSDHVLRWWMTQGEPTPERVEEQYGPAIDGRTPTRMWIAEANGRSVGFLQDYRIAEYPQFALLTSAPEAIGLDYAVGEASATGRGLGTRMVWAWAVRALHRFPEASSYFAAPDHRNAASLRVLEKVGFTRGLWFDEPQADGTTATVVGCTFEVRRVLGGAHGAGAPDARH